MKPTEYMEKSVCRASAYYEPMDVVTQHGIIGVVKEAGELADLMCKATFYQKVISRDNIVDECGDILWYMALLLHSVGATFEEVFDKNVIKLDKRYDKANKFSLEAYNAKDKEAELRAQREADKA